MVRMRNFLLDYQRYRDTNLITIPNCKIFSMKFKLKIEVIDVNLNFKLIWEGIITWLGH